MQEDDPITQVLGGPGVETVETHGSRVFLHPADVYKVKKPVRFPFLDYTTLDLRRRACLEELSVNRRSSPDTYLGVRPLLRGPDGSVQLGAPLANAQSPDDQALEVVDWVVHMRRLPDARRADIRLEAGELNTDDLEAIAAYLVQFHASVDHVRGGDAPSALEALTKNVAENLDSLEPYARQILGTESAQRLRANHLRALDEIAPLMTRRLGEGRVVDGHGDFRLEHVYLDADGQVTLLDAIEFDRTFRVADVCADVAFFAMDLSSRGRTDLAEGFVAAYARVSGDHDVYALIDFYMTYWAMVRAKVDAVRSEQLEAEHSDEALEHCSRLLFLASHLSDGACRGRALIAVTGIIACGKSRVARTLGGTMAAPVVSSDRVRKQLADAAPTDDLSTLPYAGAYSEAATRAVYQDLVRRAEVVLRAGRPVVLDATFQEEQAREEVTALATSLGVPHLFIECRAPKEEIRARLERRTDRPHNSDARAPLLDRFESQYPRWEEADGAHHVVVDTSLPRESVDQRVLELARGLRRQSRPASSLSVPRDE